MYIKKQKNGILKLYAHSISKNHFAICKTVKEEKNSK